MESDNCYGQSSANILPNFLGSILELFTSTSNIIILMICGAQFRNELIEILHLKKFFPKIQQQQQQQQYRANQPKGNRKRPKKKSTRRIPLLLRSSSQNGTGTTDNIPHDPSIDSLMISYHNRDDMSLTEVEQPSEETSQSHVRATTIV